MSNEQFNMSAHDPNFHNALTAHINRQNNQSMNQSTNQSMNQSIFQSNNQQSNFQSINQSSNSHSNNQSNVQTMNQSITGADGQCFSESRSSSSHVDELGQKIVTEKIMRHDPTTHQSIDQTDITTFRTDGSVEQIILRSGEAPIHTITNTPGQLI